MLRKMEKVKMVLKGRKEEKEKLSTVKELEMEGFKEMGKYGGQEQRKTEKKEKFMKGQKKEVEEREKGEEKDMKNVMKRMKTEGQKMRKKV